MSSASDSRPVTPEPEAGHDPADPNRPISEERDSPTPPAANPDLDMDQVEDDNPGALSDESDLSDIDEAQFEDFDPANVAIEDRPAIAVDESNVNLLGVHRRKRAEGEAAEGKKKKKEGKRREKKSRKAAEDEDSDAFSGGEEVQGKRERKRKPAGERKERAAPRQRTPENEEELTPEERRRRALDRAMDAALKNPTKRRRKYDGDDLEASADDLIAEMRTRMAEAAEADNEMRDKGLVAHQKLKLLPDVMALLNRNTLQQSLVDPDQNIMQSVRFFLEPLNDGSLPAYNIQRDLFSALGKLPINQDTLIASGIGKVVLFYTKSKRPEVGIKRQAEKLLGEWSRPILKRTDDYRKKAMMSADYDPTKLPIRSSQAQSQRISTQEAREAALAPPVRGANRARAPAGVTSYSIAPKSVGINHSVHARPMGASGDRRFRQMTQTQRGRVKR
ncbi:MAG: Transcription factor iws1 [Caeruleum heppii]|nr:MAG: Transcription factor iws1 [Caeruleum heppii]